MKFKFAVRDYSTVPDGNFFFRNYNAYSIACAIPVAINIFFGASTYQLAAFIGYVHNFSELYKALFL